MTKNDMAEKEKGKIPKNKQASAEGIADGIIVKVKEGKDLSSLAIGSSAVKSGKKLAVAKNIQKNVYIQKYGIDRLYLIQSADDDTILKALQNDPAVEYAEPNYLVSIVKTPNDPNFTASYALHNDGQTGGTSDADIDAPEAWERRTDSHTIIVSVIDTGVDYAHEDLAENMWINQNEIPSNSIDDDANGFIDDVRGWDFLNNDNDPSDDYGHGTHVAGIIGAVGNNSKGSVGVSWNAKVMPLKSIGPNGTGGIAYSIQAIEYAIQMGVDIMSNSWSLGGPSQSLKDAIMAANDAGILFVVAAGNGGNDVDNLPLFLSTEDIPNIVAVAATNYNDYKLNSSSYGVRSVDIGAPGGSIFSTVPTGVCSMCKPSGYGYSSGTSMATPFVAGAAALVKAEYPSLNSTGLKSRLLSSVDLVPSLSGIVLSNGRLNLNKMLDPALVVDTLPPSAINNLNATPATQTSIILQWTAPRESGSLGKAAYYDIRYAMIPITEQNWETATKLLNEPLPAAVPATENWEIVGLQGKTRYYFGIKAVDNVGNPSALSNVVSGKTLPPPSLLSVSDDFDPILDWTQWETVSSGTADALCGSVSGNALHFTNSVDRGMGNTSNTTREAVTKGVNTTLGGVVMFSLKFGGDALVCKNADYGENVVLEYSTNQEETWDLLATYQVADFLQFTMVNESIPTAAQAGYTQFRFRQISNSGGDTDNWAIDNVFIGVPLPPNTPPTANAGPDLVVTDSDVSGAENIILDGSGSTDPDGTITSYLWTEGGTSIGSGAMLTSSFPVGTHIIRLTVTDDHGAAASDELTIIINAPPTANAGQDLTTTDFDNTGAEIVLLNGTLSADQDGTITKYTWNEGTTTLGTGALLSKAFTVGMHTVQLTVVDDRNANSSDTLVVTVLPKPDTVNIIKATYQISTKKLQVDATSDNSVAVLAVVGYGQMTKLKNGVHRLLVSGVQNPGPMVTVTSSKGGSDTEAVQLK